MRKITEFPGYFITENGEVFSIKYGSIRQLKPLQTIHGYLRVALCKNNKPHYRNIARLVAEYFLDSWEGTLQVNHIDGVKTNNNLSNLEMCTPSENLKHAHRLGLRNNFGENHSQSKLNKESVVCIRFLIENSLADVVKIASAYNVTRSCIDQIISRRCWRHI